MITDNIGCIEILGACLGCFDEEEIEQIIILINNDTHKLKR
jgi:hypothetical protein